MNRGSIARARGAVHGTTCFNEAPIHESGKCESDRRATEADRRFNEAPIHESGKCGVDGESKTIEVTLQ